MLLVTESRWKKAQKYERQYWQKRAAQIEDEETQKLQWYGWRANKLEKRLEKVGLKNTLTSSFKLEVGCGPIGVISFLPGEGRVGIDPLERFYSSSPSLVEVRDKTVAYVEGVGEYIPFEENSASLVVVDNCIDHVRSASEVLSEVSRVLEPGGAVYIAVNCRSTVGYWVHRLFSILLIDAGHPHTYTVKRIVQDVRRHFRIADVQQESAFQAWWKDLRSTSLRGLLKAMTGTSEFVVEIVAVNWASE